MAALYHAWARGGEDRHRIEIPAERISRISPDHLARERRALGESWFRHEYCCSFEALEGLVYADFARCVVPGPAPTVGKHVGGIDFGLRDPFAAVRDVLTQEGVLWLTGEHFDRDKSLAFHAAHLPRGYMWYGDPAEAREIKELHCAGFPVRRADHDVRPGIAAVRARLESGMLRVIEGTRCPLFPSHEVRQYVSTEKEATASRQAGRHRHHAAQRWKLASYRGDSRAGRR